MGLPFPAKSEERAAELADKAAEIWRGTVVYLERAAPPERAARGARRSSA